HPRGHRETPHVRGLLDLPVLLVVHDDLQPLTHDLSIAYSTAPPQEGSRGPAGRGAAERASLVMTVPLSTSSFRSAATGPGRPPRPRRCHPRALVAVLSCAAAAACSDDGLSPVEPVTLLEIVELRPSTLVEGDT